MPIARTIGVSILAVGLAVTLSSVSLGHGEEHESHHETHHESHHEAHHGEHHEAHHGEHRDEHGDRRPGEHRDEHHADHDDDHHDWRPNEHHADHHDDHHDWRPNEHHADHHDDHHDWRPGEHHADHRDDYYAHDRYAGIDHRDWYRHAWWHHQPSWHNRPWQHWWHHPTVNEFAAWSAGWGLAAPVYYNYGPGGNVVYRNNQVYVNDALVGTADTYANSATALAQASAATNPTDDQSADWLPLGTFAMLRNGDDTKPSQTLQLALSKSGTISGVLFDLQADTSTPVHGSLDRATQRLAFAMGAKSGLVAETGLYNLSKDRITLLVHKGKERPQIYTLVRFQATPPGVQAMDLGMQSR